MRLVKRLTLALLLLLATPVYAQRSGSGIFTGPSNCNDVVPGPANTTFCMDYTTGAVWVQNGTAWVQISGSSSGTGNMTIGGITAGSINVTGTLTYPDASTYTAAGHNSMAAIGIGEPVQAGRLLAATLNADAGASILVSNPNITGTSVNAGFEIDTGTGGSVYPTYIAGYGPGWTANPFFPGSSFAIETSEPNGLYLGTNVAPDTVNINIANTLVAQFANTPPQISGLKLGGYAGAVNSNYGVPAIMIGNAYLSGTTWANLNISGAAYFNGTNWIMDGGAGTGTAMLQVNAGNVSLFTGTGGPAGTVVNFTQDLYVQSGVPTVVIPNNSTTGLQVGNAFIASVGGGNINIVSAGYYNGANWISTSAGPFALINQTPGADGFYYGPANAGAGNVINWVQEASIGSSGLTVFGGASMNNGLYVYGANPAQYIISQTNTSADILQVLPQNQTQGVGLWFGGVHAVGSSGNTILNLDGQGPGNIYLNAANASATWSYGNIGTVNNHHLWSSRDSGPAPGIVSGCVNGSVDGASTDNAGRISFAGSGATSCTIGFGRAFNGNVYCTCNVTQGLNVIGRCYAQANTSQVGFNFDSGIQSNLGSMIWHCLGVGING